MISSLLYFPVQIQAIVTWSVVNKHNRTHCLQVYNMYYYMYINQISLEALKSQRIQRDFKRFCPPNIKRKMDGFDLIQRDPNGINSHLGVCLTCFYQIQQFFVKKLQQQHKIIVLFTNAQSFKTFAIGYRICVYVTPFQKKKSRIQKRYF